MSSEDKSSSVLTTAPPSQPLASSRADSPAGTDVRPGAGKRSLTTPLPAAVLGEEEESIALPTGYSLQEYTIRSVLGRGGFGITYRAYDNNLQCDVAIKEYLPDDLAWRSDGETVCSKTAADLQGFRQGLGRFLAESRTLAGFKHPHIVRVVRFFEANNTAYMVMDYEQGESLRDWMASHGPVDEDTLLQMFLPLLDGLEAVHRKGVLHRDIKPSNIYVRHDRSLVLLDFGSARDMAAAMTRSLASIITPGYAPLEQYHSQGGQGPWTDLYALAGVLYWAITAQRPCDAPLRVKDDPLTKAGKLGRGRYSDALLAAVDWGLVPEAAARPRGVTEFRSALLGEISPPHSDASDPPSGASRVIPSKRPHTGQLLAGSLAVLLLVLAGGYIFWPKGTPGTASMTEESRVAAQAAAVPPAEPGSSASKKGSASAPVAAEAPVAGAARDKASPAKPKGRAEAAQPVKEEKEKAVAGKGGGGSAAFLVFDVTPGSEIWVDDKLIGRSPPLTRLAVAPGKHRIKIGGDQAPWYYHYTVTLEEKQTHRVAATFAPPAQTF